MGRTRASILNHGEKLTLLDNANLSSGGTSIDFTDSIHISFREIAINAAKILGLRLCGVDIITNDITQDPSNQLWNIIELNASPGLDNYAAMGLEQKKRVDNLYRKVLEFLQENHS